MSVLTHTTTFDELRVGDVFEFDRSRVDAKRGLFQRAPAGHGAVAWSQEDGHAVVCQADTPVIRRPELPARWAEAP